MKAVLKIAGITSLAIILSACDRDPKLAEVNGKSISENEVSAYLKFKRVPEKDIKRKDALIKQYLEREAMAAVIENSDVLNKKQIEAELNEFRKEMLISRYFQKFLTNSVTDEAVKNYYNNHASDYENRKVNVAHILIRTNLKMGEAERKAKLTTAQEAYSKVKSGKKFEDIAKAYSEDKISGKKGGSLGWIREGAIDKKFSETVFAMEKDAISEPFETPFGFHIVKLLDGPAVVKRPFESVKGDVRYQLRNKAKQAEIERMRKKAKIVRYDK